MIVICLSFYYINKIISKKTKATLFGEVGPGGFFPYLEQPGEAQCPHTFLLGHFPCMLAALSEWEQFEALVCPQHQVAKGLRVRAFPLLVWHSSSNTSWELRQQETWPGHILSNRQLQRAADSPNTQGLAASLPTRSLCTRPGYSCGHRVFRAPAGKGGPPFFGKVNVRDTLGIAKVGIDITLLTDQMGEGLTTYTRNKRREKMNRAATRLGSGMLLSVVLWSLHRGDLLRKQPGSPGNDHKEPVSTPAHTLS